MLVIPADELWQDLDEDHDPILLDFLAVFNSLKNNIILLDAWTERDGNWEHCLMVALLFPEWTFSVRGDGENERLSHGAFSMKCHNA